MNWLTVGVSIAVLVTLVIVILLWFKRQVVPKPAKLRDNSEYPQQLNLSQSLTKATDSREQVFRKQYLILPEKLKFTTTLTKLLVSGRWSEADQETLKIMLKVTKREKEGWLDVASIDNFPCEDLQELDRLWVESSKGRFGFSVQRHIWKSVGGELGVSDRIYEAFGDDVGWRAHQKWLQVNELTFNLSSPMGHLPAVAVRLGGLSWGVEGFLWAKRDAYVFLVSRKDW